MLEGYKCEVNLFQVSFFRKYKIPKKTQNFNRNRSKMFDKPGFFFFKRRKVEIKTLPFYWGTKYFKSKNVYDLGLQYELDLRNCRPGGSEPYPAVEYE